MRKTLLIGCTVALALVSNVARAELELTLTIRGDVPEMITVLQQLQLLGLGDSAPDASDPLKLRVESVHEQDTAEAPVKTAPLEPVLALTRPTASPATVAPGAELTLTVAVIDERRVVDTLSATLIGTGLAFDLFDNGTHGDAMPADGVWTVTFTVPPETPVGEYEATFLVYDGAGNALTVSAEEGGNTALTASTVVTVGVPEAPAPVEVSAAPAPESTPASE